MHTNLNAKKKKMADSVCHNGNTAKMPKKKKNAHNLKSCQKVKMKTIICVHSLFKTTNLQTFF